MRLGTALMCAAWSVTACGTTKDAQRAAASPVGTTTEPVAATPIPDDAEVSRPTEHPRTILQRREELYNTGVALFLGFMVISIWTAGIGDLICTGGCKDHTYDLLYLPVIGPGIGAALPGAAGAGRVLLAADSGLQVSGLVLMLIGSVWKHEVESVGVSWTIMPGAAGTMAGFTFVAHAF
jgi:hypothetical protein